MSESGEPAEPALSRRDATAILLLAAGSAWGAGNIAPIVPDLASAFDLSLASVGLISGTLFFIGTIAGEAGGPKLAERIRVIRSLRLSAVLVGAGCLVLAAAPGFWALASGRVLAGLGLGVIAAVGPVFARTVGGIKGVGLFGGAFQGGIALGLGAGSVLADAGIDWRVGFLVSAAAGLSALTVLPADRRIELELTGGGFLAAAVRSAAVWRLALLFVAMFAAPLTIGAWLVHFLSVQGGMQLAVAGLLGFLLFAASGLFRFGGARLNDAGIPDAVLAGVMPLLASAGIVAIAFDQSLAVALPAVILIAAGFALPYAVMILAAQRLWPREPTEPVALMSLVGSAIPIAVIPVFGAALSDGNGDAAFVAMAIFIALAGFANVRLPRKPIPAAPGSGRLRPGARRYGRPRRRDLIEREELTMAERRTVEAIGAPEAAGPYSHAVAHGNVLYCSGQVPIDPDTGRLVEAGPGEQAARCLENLEVVCAAAGTSLDRALMVTVYVTDLAAGAEINAAYAERFATEPPARAMVEVAGLPLGASVEIAAAVVLG